MELILWRHAEAELAAAGQHDAQRALTAKGRRNAARVGAWLDRQLPAHCRILSSPAVRCRQTAEALGRKFSCDHALALDSSAAQILAASGWPAHRLPVVVVGHQPLLGQLAALILTGQEHDWKIRKGSVLWLSRKGEAEAPYIRLSAGPDLIGRLR
ncbi:histidine phosphatase family protein [Massilia agilis]|uniref:Histidine phosphatase family protein n=1 Tax=Massilia agilis TaxID=1811226 RepID=A0ABT2D7T9_9BURK|nr:histidine phosphatase family protein [Massilia agilis]MCS0806493.1 histidine phosphatase family protein [Massilia agilis]